ncbi:hypothetical protein J4440_01980 [Candidatus Woesearchaeota archaeon]|nr:hypothetical protein [Candidatus Woesearchaeota archaeon]
MSKKIDLFSRVNTLWYNLLNQIHNLMLHTQTTEPDIEKIRNIRTALNGTYQILKRMLTEGNKAILNRQYGIAVKSCNLMMKYTLKDVNDIINLRRELQEIMKLRL